MCAVVWVASAAFAVVLAVLVSAAVLSPRLSPASPCLASAATAVVSCLLKVRPCRGHTAD